MHIQTKLLALLLAGMLAAACKTPQTTTTTTPKEAMQAKEAFVGKTEKRYNADKTHYICIGRTAKTDPYPSFFVADAKSDSVVFRTGPVESARWFDATHVEFQRLRGQVQVGQEKKKDHKYLNVSTGELSGKAPSE